MAKKLDIVWAKKPTADDYLAAESYLSLLFQPTVVSALVQRLRKAPVVQYVVRDVLRAVGYLMLGVRDSAEERRAIRAGKRIAPVLLVRNEDLGTLIVADGYHRLCTVYKLDEEATVHCKIV